MLSNICKQNLYVDISTQASNDYAIPHITESAPFLIKNITAASFSDLLPQPFHLCQDGLLQRSTLHVIPASITGEEEDPRDSTSGFSQESHPIHPGKTATHRDF